MNARYYDPSIGRFLSEDPVGLGGGDLTLYSYAGKYSGGFCGSERVVCDK